MKKKVLFKDIELGQEFCFDGIEWVKIGCETRTLCLSKKNIPLSIVGPNEKSFSYFVSEGWKNSALRAAMNRLFFLPEKFYEKYSQDIRADDGTVFWDRTCAMSIYRVKDKISLLTAWDYRNYRDQIPPLDEEYVLLNPMTHDVELLNRNYDGANMLCVVKRDGTIGYIDVPYVDRVRPVIKLKDDNIVNIELPEEKCCEDHNDIDFQDIINTLNFCMSKIDGLAKTIEKYKR